MQNSVKQLNFKGINLMLIELAMGNYAYRIDLREYDGQLRELVAMLNAVADKIQLLKENPSNEIPIAAIQKQTVPAKPSEADVVWEVFNYILAHLEDPLPSARELAKMFGTNEFTIKHNFREILDTSIYQFYNDERLKKAHRLIDETTIPLKEIAFLCGFNDYTNFYKAFKKKFSYTPRDIMRKNR